MRKVLFLALAVFTTSACSAYVDQEAIFVGYNDGSNSIQILVDGVGTELLGPGRSSQFPVKIQVPRSMVGATGPSAIDRTVQVSIAVRNLSTSNQTGPVFCQAGAKVKTHIWYEVISGRESVRCTTSY